MIVYPAIDLKGGQCVRLVQGDMAQATVYGTDPAAMARSFAAQGAQWLHVVDLDGAFAGDSRNLTAIAAIVAAAGLPVQVGGGLRNMAHLERMLGEIGAARAILGTAALRDRAFLSEAVGRWGTERIAVGIDARDGRVAVNGWAELTDQTPIALASEVAALGLRTIVYTDISRDGMLSGPNFEATARLITETGLDVILSGGVGAPEHVRRAKEIGAAGAIVGKAIYTGAVDLKDAIALGGQDADL